jgi:hypothetical protein
MHGIVIRLYIQVVIEQYAHRTPTTPKGFNDCFMRHSCITIGLKQLWVRLIVTIFKK